MSEIKMYFKGGKGIKNPVDFNGDIIKEGDILTHSWFENDYVEFFRKQINITDLEEIERRVYLPSVIVKYNSEEDFFYGEGIKEPEKYSSKLYMHDFRFKYTKIVKQ